MVSMRSKITKLVIGCCLMLIPTFLAAEGEHAEEHAQAHHAFTHIQALNFEEAGKMRALLAAFSEKDESLGQALAESLAKIGYGIFQNLNFKMEGKKKVPDGAGLKIFKSGPMGYVVLEAKADFFVPDYPHQVVGHNQEAPGMDDAVKIIQRITKKRSECQAKVGLPIGSPFFGKNKKLKAVVSPGSKLALCAEPLGDLDLLEKVGQKAVGKLHLYISAAKFDEANRLLASWQTQ